MPRIITYSNLRFETTKRFEASKFSVFLLQCYQQNMNVIFGNTSDPNNNLTKTKVKWIEVNCIH